MKKNCISRFFGFITRIIRLWRTIRKNSMLVKCNRHDKSTHVEVHVPDDRIEPPDDNE